MGIYLRTPTTNKPTHRNVFSHMKFHATDMGEQELWDGVGEDDNMFPKAEPDIAQDDK